MAENVQNNKTGIKGVWNKTVNAVKSIEWNKTVKPVIAYSIFGGAVALAVLLGVLIICL